MWRGERLIAVQDCANHNALTYPYGVLKFFVLCSRAGGWFSANIETTEIRYFEEDRLPRLSETRKHRGTNRHVFCAHRDPGLDDAILSEPREGIRTCVARHRLGHRADGEHRFRTLTPNRRSRSCGKIRVQAMQNQVAIVMQIGSARKSM